MSKKGRVKRKKYKYQKRVYPEYVQKMLMACYNLVYRIGCRYSDTFSKDYILYLLRMCDQTMVEAAIEDSNVSNIRENVLSACQKTFEDALQSPGFDNYWFCMNPFTLSAGDYIDALTWSLYKEEKELNQTICKLLTNVKASAEYQEWEKTRHYLTEEELANDDFADYMKEFYYEDPLSGAWEFIYELIHTEIAKLEWIDTELEWFDDNLIH